MTSLLDKAIMEAKKLPESTQDNIGSILLSFVYRASASAGTTEFPVSFAPENDGKEKEYDLVEDINIVIARGIVEASAHQRGEIDLPNTRETLESFMTSERGYVSAH
uniref:Uncharacterized protein n=1 Tax=Candidatus Kentrum sp. MB TaxID=2138164 RepID=A0A450Y2A7_9GAMM|nr:MAG: hypothetical protein BECKMB1821G_GA0114241_113010 [Candidatus Kentron sp. MB]VFK35676.1 MAG: hypothetical protein BECKMB1821I_GA0114274_113610 [Candidatus Kentron sp. MB]VFK77432.1 MAG: hypothetical protein BECKMB1821H_GA0114242_113710 [Candidatus Kentron sp. MB]